MNKSEAKPPLQKAKPMLPYLLIPLIILVAALLISVANPPPRQYLESRYGEFDLRGYDYENYVIGLFGIVEYIPNALLTPDEFQAWASDPENETEFGWVSGYETVTSRIRLYVEDGKWYTFTRYSIEFSQRLYVNGEWLLNIGSPGETPQTDIPNTGRITFTAQGVDGVIEIIQQSSNHVHRMGGNHTWMSVGTGTLLSDWARAEQYQTSIILGSFMMLAILFLVLFFTHGRNYANLLFATFCFAWFMRIGVTGNRVFTVIFPQLSWFVKFRIEYIVIPLSAILTVAIINRLYKGMLHKWGLYAVYGVSAVFILLFLFLDTVVMNDTLYIMFVIYIATALWLLACFVIYIYKRHKTEANIFNTEQKMFAFGLLLFIGAALSDTGYFIRLFHMPPFHMTGVAVLVFALLEAVAVFTSNMREVEEAKKNELDAILKGQALAIEKAALEKVSGMKTEFLATISHELKTPLTVISNNAQLARMHAEDNQQTESSFISETMRLITGDAERMNMLINQLLDASRIEESRMSYKFAPEDISEIIRNTISTFKTELDKKNNNPVMHLPESLGSVYCDRERIHQVLMNLLSNANRFTKGGEITISAEEKQRFISISVADTGEGIPETVKETIFDRYTTANPKSDKSLSGTGLGLYISKHIIEAHGGAIKAESENGQGTVMSFTLPIYKEESSG